MSLLQQQHRRLASRLLKSIDNNASRFALRSDAVSVLETPGDFHGVLCDMIRKATDRVYLATLYVGPGVSCPKEQELLESLHSLPSDIRVRVLMDANRGERPVSAPLTTKTSSADAVRRNLVNHPDGLRLFQVLPNPWSRVLPSPANEVAGVFHIKAYVVDDKLILSGSNLSQEYFVDRQDRYMLFQNGAGGLVDFYATMIETLSNSTNTDSSSTHQELMSTLARLFQQNTNNATTVMDEDDNVEAYVVPTFQPPKSWKDLPFRSDAQHIDSFLRQTALESNCSIRLASAYLNPTPSLMSALAHNHGDVTFLTASPSSHGFSPKPGVKRRGDWVPQAFQHISYQLNKNRRNNTDRLLWYTRDGWTFHAKGIWIFSPEGHLVAATVGSGNYGYRSYQRDMESNCLLVFPKTDSALQRALMDEWDRFEHYTHKPIFSEQAPWRIRAALPLMKRML